MYVAITRRSAGHSVGRGAPQQLLWCRTTVAAIGVEPCCSTRAAVGLLSSSGTTRRGYASSSSSANHARSPLRLIIIGPPGGGKGTQAEKIERDYGLTQISTGQLLRAERDAKTVVGLQIEKVLQRGELVDDDLMIELVKGAFLRLTNPKGWLLDGYPRTTAQAEQLTDLLKEIRQPLTGVLYIDVDKKVIAERLKDRYIHPGSGRTYNLKYNPPKVPGKDDVTGEDLIQREDDKPETVLSRLTVYEEKTRPVLDYYQRVGLLHTVDSPNSDVGYERIKKVMAEFIGQ